MRSLKGLLIFLITIILLTSSSFQATPSSRYLLHANRIFSDIVGVYATDVTNQPPGGANETTAMLSQMMSRVENIRGLKFLEAVRVESISRSEYANQYRGETTSVSEEFWELAQQEYEALYLLEEGVSARSESESFYTAAILGFYDADKDEIVLVDSLEELDEGTLAHELAHALIDQYYPQTFGFSSNLTDESFAVYALLEGDACLVEAEYRESFMDQGTGGGVIGSRTIAHLPGFTVIQIFPYLEGVNFVSQLRKLKGGWWGVNRVYDGLPQSTEQIIHVERYGTDFPTEIIVPDRVSEGWRLLGRDTLGEFAIFTMFLDKNQVHASINKLTRTPTYSSPLSDGWDGDDMAVYKNSEGLYGYVWQIIWDSERDAEEFIIGYEDMLLDMGATLAEGIWRIDSNDFVKIWREGRVTCIVNGPTPEEISEIYPPRKPVYYNVTFNAPDGVDLVIDDVTYNSHDLPVSFLWQDGSIHTFATPQKVAVGERVRWAFLRWDDGSDATERAVTVDRAYSYNVTFKLQYYLQIESPYGDPTGEGWYDAGTLANISVTSPYGPSGRYVFTGWSGDLTAASTNATVLMDSPKRVVANWGHEYTQVFTIVLPVAVALVAVLSIFLTIKRKTIKAPQIVNKGGNLTID
ncbi:MAG: Hvo_1808 family surface protein [Candidatus Bathyarchaeia archaeon]